MNTLLVRPQSLVSRSDLDAWLHRGFRSTGQCLYYSDFVRDSNDDLHGVVQTRLPLRDFKFKRKQRRLLRQNGEQFTVEIGPVHHLTPDFYDVNERYLKAHPDKSVEALWSFVDDGFGNQFLPTHAVEVFLRGRLIAFSFFDPGKRNVYSKSGIYDPQYANFSLGNYTLLLEVQWARENGLEYYHPGYYSPTWPVFHYKLRLGPMEFKDCRDGAWKAMPDNDPAYPPDPVGIVRAALAKVLAAARRLSLKLILFEYPSFTARYFHEGTGGNLLDTPLFIRPAGIPTSWPDRLLTYNFHTGHYEVLEYVPSSLRDTRLVVRPDDAVKRFPYPLEVTGRHATSPDPEKILRAL